MERPQRETIRKAVQRDVRSLIDGIQKSANASREKLERSAEELAQRIGEELLNIHRTAERRDEEWNAIKTAYSEKLKLQAPAKLWEDRSSEHSTRAEKAVKALAIAGVTALIAIALWVWGAFAFADWLFSEAVVAGPVPGSARENALIAAAKSAAAIQAISHPMVRPTFHAELIFVGSATLLFITLVVWGLRLLVRNYTTEQHLAIDARSRAVMATTYLGLIEGQAAVAESDRAIILAALFRAVTDGMIKDDGPPALTPAAVASGVLATKTGQ